MNVELDLVGAIVAFASFLGLTYRYYIRPRNILIEKAISSRPIIDKIYAEMFPNHGSSMRDSVNRIEKLGQELSDQLVRVSTKQHAVLLEHEDGYFETDDKGYCTGVNRTYCYMTGRPESEVLGTGWVHVIHPEDRELVKDEWVDCVDGNRDFRLKYRIIRPNGDTITVIGQANPLINPYTKKLLGYIGTIKHIK